MGQKKFNHNKGTGQIRIISGKWRGRKLPVADSEGLRPTTDRTKETLFNWLMPYMANMTHCLDLFAGSGGLGIEALSRGADRVTLVEKLPNIVRKLKEIRSILGVSADQFHVENADGLQFLQQTNQKYSLVFVDPPYHKELVSPSVDALLKSGCLSKSALVYIEHESDLQWTAPEDLVELKHKSTQQFVYRLLQLK